MERKLTPEEMDNPGIDPRVHGHALRGLARINAFTGVAPAIYRRIRRYALALQRPIRVLDIGSGAGDLPVAWARRAKHDQLDLRITGCDMSPTAIEHATSLASRHGVDAQFMQRDVLEDRLPTGFDVVTCSLFMHHLTEAQLVRLLQNMQIASSYAIIVCDLERSRLNQALVWVAAHALSRSQIVHNDAMRSVHSAFTRQEFNRLAEQALGRPMAIEGLPPCRFIATCDEAVVKAPESVLAGLQSA